MRFLRTVAFALLAAMAGYGVAWSQGVPNLHAPKRFTVGIGRGPVLRGATAPGGTLTVSRATTCLQADGSQQITLIYTRADGQNVHQRTLFVDAGCTKVTDSYGNVVSATGPTAECTAATSFTSQEDTTIGNAAGSGKLNL